MRAEDIGKQRGNENFFLNGGTSQAVKVRTTKTAKPGSRRCQAVALSGHFYGEIWNWRETKSIKHSESAQSHASLPTTIRALISAFRTRKLRCQMQQSWPSSNIDHKLYLATSRWAKANEEKEDMRLKEEGNERCRRNQRKHVQKHQRSQRAKGASRQLC